MQLSSPPLLAKHLCHSGLHLYYTLLVMDFSILLVRETRKSIPHVETNKIR